MALVAPGEYRYVTLDSTSTDGAVSGALAVAVELAEQITDRQFVQAERTERLRPDAWGRVWPSATPIVSVSSPANTRVDGAAVFTGWSSLLFPDRTLVGLSWADPTVEVTYTGGWTADTLPADLRRVLCELAFDLLHPDETLTGVPVGATTVQVGDARLSTSTPGGFDPFRFVRPGLRARLRGWRKARVVV
jgi:hypothetical protein